MLMTQLFNVHWKSSDMIEQWSHSFQIILHGYPLQHTVSNQRSMDRQICAVILIFSWKKQISTVTVIQVDKSESRTSDGSLSRPPETVRGPLETLRSPPKDHRSQYGNHCITNTLQIMNSECKAFFSAC